MPKLLFAAVGLMLALAVPASARPVAKAGEMCGGLAAIQCGGQLWCDPQAGRCKGADISGVCVPATGICTRIFKPVCGCDGKTYGNDCMRQAAKTALDYPGACKPDRRS